MLTFEYEAMNSEGRTVRGTIQAENNDDAIEKIREMNLVPTHVTEPGAEGGCASGAAAVVLLALAAGVWALLG
ncbi:MAG: hypothetical protein AMK73_08305 [Planctomycetes bacterium SM23_32]|nr:MAG: hypothetical protein AMK73_08305 [Planctomycetes bacterium SM23_32]